MAYDYDLLVLGAGPGGYVAAIRAAQLGLKTAVVERDKPGGVCLNIGCIPSKSLIHQAKIFGSIDRLKAMGVAVDAAGFDYRRVQAKSREAAEKLAGGVRHLLKKNGIELVAGNGRLASAHSIELDGKRALSGRFVLVATGSRPRTIPGFEFDEKKILSSTGALLMEALPRRLVILGAGAIGMEFAYVMRAFGVEVTVVEMLDRILPMEDAETAAVVEKAFRGRGVRFLSSTQALGWKPTGQGLAVSLRGREGELKLEADQVLVAVGRAPNTEGLNLEGLGIKTERGFVQAGDYYRTAVDGVYAVGDIVPSPQLAHVASKEGEIAVEHMAGLDPEPRLDPGLIPSAVYCEPQIGSFGLSEEKARTAGLAFKKAVFPYRGAGKAVAAESVEGLVKIIFDPETKEILGAHAVGAQATELIHELLLARAGELTTAEVAGLVHAHPTLSEAVMEAARAAEGWAIHV